MSVGRSRHENHVVARLNDRPVERAKETGHNAQLIESFGCVARGGNSICFSSRQNDGTKVWTHIDRENLSEQ
jgi:hypothetical protein